MICGKCKEEHRNYAGGLECCTAHSSRTKKACTKRPVGGGVVCDTHGGKAPEVRRVAAQRQQQQQALGRVASLVRLYEGENPEADVDPGAVLIRMLRQALVAEKVLSDLVEEECGVEWLTEVSYGVQGRRLEVHPYVKLHHDVQERAAKFAKMALDAGVEERATQALEAEAGTIAGEFRMAVYNVELKLEPWQQQRLLADFAKRLAA